MEMRVGENADAAPAVRMKKLISRESGCAEPCARESAGGTAAAASAADAMPDTQFRRQTLETSLKFAVNKNTALRFYHRYERVSIDDWHYDGLPLVLANGAGVFLGAGPQQYGVHILGVFFQYAPGKQEKTGL